MGAGTRDDAPESTRARIAAMAPEVLAACDESPEPARGAVILAGRALAVVREPQAPSALPKAERGPWIAVWQGLSAELQNTPE